MLSLPHLYPKMGWQDFREILRLSSFSISEMFSGSQSLLWTF